MFDICFVDGVDDVIEYHVKAENTFNPVSYTHLRAH